MTPKPQRISPQRVREIEKRIIRSCTHSAAAICGPCQHSADDLRQLADQLEHDAKVIEAARAFVCSRCNNTGKYRQELCVDPERNWKEIPCNCVTLHQALADLDRT